MNVIGLSLRGSLKALFSNLDIFLLINVSWRLHQDTLRNSQHNLGGNYDFEVKELCSYYVVGLGLWLSDVLQAPKLRGTEGRGTVERRRTSSYLGTGVVDFRVQGCLVHVWSASPRNPSRVAGATAYLLASPRPFRRHMKDRLKESLSC